MIIDLPRKTYKTSNDVYHYLLMSDLHIGAANCDKQRIVDDLDWAKANKADVFIAGDVFDALWPKDHKRFNPSALDPLITSTDAVLNAALKLGVKMLKPYAELIRMIGCGNHETATIKYHSADMIAMLIEQLGGDVRHGGYTGAIRQNFRRKDGGGTQFVVYYHHGIGGAAPVTKGMIDFNRFSSWVRGADVLWLGHKHNRFACQVQECRVPEKSKDLELVNVWHVMSGAYTTPQGHRQFDDDGNYQSHWSIEKGFAPQGQGGAKLAVHIDRSDGSAARPACEVIM